MLMSALTLSDIDSRTYIDTCDNNAVSFVPANKKHNTGRSIYLSEEAFRFDKVVFVRQNDRKSVRLLHPKPITHNKTNLVLITAKTLRGSLSSVLLAIEWQRERERRECERTTLRDKGNETNQKYCQACSS
jgi:hypothetical protein